MADNVAVTAGTGTTIAADEVSDGTLGSVKVQYVKLMDGTLDSTTKAPVTADGLTVKGKVWDGTNTAAVKAGSTPPVAGDAALVVTISPNGINTNGAKTSATSAPSVLATDEATLSVAMDTTQLMNGVSGIGLAAAKIKLAVTTATTTTLLAAQGAGIKIRIVSLYLVTSAANTITLQSGTTTSNSDGGLAHAANSGIVLPFNPLGWFDTTANEALQMVTSATANVSGQITYVKGNF